MFSHASRTGGAHVCACVATMATVDVMSDIEASSKLRVELQSQVASWAAEGELTIEFYRARYGERLSLFTLLLFELKEAVSNIFNGASCSGFERCLGTLVEKTTGSDDEERGRVRLVASMYFLIHKCKREADDRAHRQAEQMRTERREHTKQVAALTRQVERTIHTRGQLSRDREITFKGLSSILSKTLEVMRTVETAVLTGKKAAEASRLEANETLATCKRLINDVRSSKAAKQVWMKRRTGFRDALVQADSVAQMLKDRRRGSDEQQTQTIALAERFCKALRDADANEGRWVDHNEKLKNLHHMICDIAYDKEPTDVVGMPPSPAGLELPLPVPPDALQFGVSCGEGDGQWFGDGEGDGPGSPAEETGPNPEVLSAQYREIVALMGQMEEMMFMAIPKRVPVSSPCAPASLVGTSVTPMVMFHAFSTIPGMSIDKVDRRYKELARTLRDLRGILGTSGYAAAASGNPCTTCFWHDVPAFPAVCAAAAAPSPLSPAASQLTQHAVELLKILSAPPPPAAVAAAAAPTDAPQQALVSPGGRARAHTGIGAGSAALSAPRCDRLASAPPSAEEPPLSASSPLHPALPSAAVLRQPKGMAGVRRMRAASRISQAATVAAAAAPPPPPPPPSEHPRAKELRGLMQTDVEAAAEDDRQAQWEARGCWATGFLREAREREQGRTAGAPGAAPSAANAPAAAAAAAMECSTASRPRVSSSASTASAAECDDLESYEQHDDDIGPLPHVVSCITSFNEAVDSFKSLFYSIVTSSYDGGALAVRLDKVREDVQALPSLDTTDVTEALGLELSVNHAPGFVRTGVGLTIDTEFAGSGSGGSPPATHVVGNKYTLCRLAIDELLPTVEALADGIASIAAEIQEQLQSSGPDLRRRSDEPTDAAPGGNAEGLVRPKAKRRSAGKRYAESVAGLVAIAGEAREAIRPVLPNRDDEDAAAERARVVGEAMRMIEAQTVPASELLSSPGTRLHTLFQVRELFKYNLRALREAEDATPPSMLLQLHHLYLAVRTRLDAALEQAKATFYNDLCAESSAVSTHHDRDWREVKELVSEIRNGVLRVRHRHGACAFGRFEEVVHRLSDGMEEAAAASVTTGLAEVGKRTKEFLTDIERKVQAHQAVSWSATPKTRSLDPVFATLKEIRAALSQALSRAGKTSQDLAKTVLFSPRVLQVRSPMDSLFSPTAASAAPALVVEPPPPVQGGVAGIDDCIEYAETMALEAQPLEEAERLAWELSAAAAEWEKANTTKDKTDVLRLAAEDAAEKVTALREVKANPVECVEEVIELLKQMRQVCLRIKRYETTPAGAHHAPTQEALKACVKRMEQLTKQRNGEWNEHRLSLVGLRAQGWARFVRHIQQHDVSRVFIPTLSMQAFNMQKFERGMSVLRTTLASPRARRPPDKQANPACPSSPRNTDAADSPTISPLGGEARLPRPPKLRPNRLCSAGVGRAKQLTEDLHAKQVVLFEGFRNTAADAVGWDPIMGLPRTTRDSGWRALMDPPCSVSPRRREGACMTMVAGAGAARQKAEAVARVREVRRSLTNADDAEIDSRRALGLTALANARPLPLTKGFE